MISQGAPGETALASVVIEPTSFRPEVESADLRACANAREWSACGCVSVRACVRACVHAGGRAGGRARARARAGVCVRMQHRAWMRACACVPRRRGMYPQQTRTPRHSKRTHSRAARAHRVPRERAVAHRRDVEEGGRVGLGACLTADLNALVHGADWHREHRVVDPFVALPVRAQTSEQAADYECRVAQPVKTAWRGAGKDTWRD
eukprot:599060-Pleurochrysis_carterae.AAC.1